jgi:hypothetical protein
MFITRFYLKDHQVTAVSQHQGQVSLAVFANAT